MIFREITCRGLRPRRDLLACLSMVVGLCLGTVNAEAQNATWTGASSGDFNTASNWSPGSVPTGIATFTNLGPSAVSINADPANTINELLFANSAPAYTFTLNGSTTDLIFGSAGPGIVNNSSFAPSFTLNDANISVRGGTLGNANITLNVISNDFASISLFNTASAGTATITNKGSVALFNSSTLGNATVSNAGTTAISAGYNFPGSVTFFVGNSTAGQARLINNATGTFDFSDTTGLNNDGKVSAGSIEGGGNIFLGANQLTVGGNNLSTTFSGVISDCAGGVCVLAQFGSPAPTGGSLVKVGTGTLELTGVNSYTGATVVNAGTLEVDGSIASSSSVTVNSGGTLSGTGTVDPATTTIMSGGTLAPGSVANPTGTLSITGNLAFQSAALYLVQVTPSAASSTVVSGTASLAGTVQATFASGAYLSKQYDILKSGGLGGTSFASLTTSNLPAGFSASLSYSATDVFLNISGSALSGIKGANINQQNVATSLNNFFNSGGALPPQFVTVFGLTGNNLGNALTQLSGETATGAQQTTYDAMSLFMGLLTDPGPDCAALARRNTTAWDNSCPDALDRRSNAYAMYSKAPLANVYDPRWSVWAAGFGGSQSTDGNAALGSNDTTSSVYGTAVGADYLLSPNTIAGFAMAGGGTNFSVANGGSGRSDLFQVGAYVRHSSGPVYVSAALAYGWQDITTDRIVTISGLDHLRAAFDANAWSGRLESGYRFVVPWVGGLGITPYAAAQFTTIDLPAYAESVVSGGGAFALAYGARDATDPRSELGIRTDKSFLVDDGVFTLRGRFAWAHDYDPNRTIDATFQALPGASFVVNGAAQAADSALTTLAAEMKWKNGWVAAATFEGEFSNVTRSYAGKGVVRYTW
jgi:autotransporter-associated beta strand protein